ncbi:MAG TPA: type I restriction endonuclease, partial [Bacteroidales bacterium]|nr:type I restriction endonuclease [Bacteroidales bacterium]
LRVVPELVYSPWATEEYLTATGSKAKSWRIDLVLFVNGIPVVTMELKSEFKQAGENAFFYNVSHDFPKNLSFYPYPPTLNFHRTLTCIPVVLAIARHNMLCLAMGKMTI